MKKDSIRRTLAKAVAEFIKRRRKGEPEEPADPHAYVTAPKKPRPNQGSTAAVLELPED